VLTSLEMTQQLFGACLNLFTHVLSFCEMVEVWSPCAVLLEAIQA